ncbi:MAG: hypothetical protein HYX51_07305, partial [Chloroflexi bacterium]|nr:hypothetical protein [Chloroflexota bacterium]
MLAGNGLVALAAASFFAAGGGGPVVPSRSLPEKNDGEGEEDKDELGRGFEAGEKFAEMLGRTFRSVGDRGVAIKERFEGFVGIYKLLKSLGMSDKDIAALVAEQARIQLGREASERTPTAADARRVMDGLQDTVIKAAQEVDVRLDLGGNFARRVRDAVQSTKTGREDALLFTERGVAVAKEQLLKVLNREAK